MGLTLALVFSFASLNAKAQSDHENQIKTPLFGTTQTTKGDNYEVLSTELEKEWIHAMGRVVRQETPESMRAVLLDVIKVNGEKPEKVNILYDGSNPKQGELQRTILKNILHGMNIPYEEYPIGDELLNEVVKRKLEKTIPNFDILANGQMRNQSAFALVKRDFKGAKDSIVDQLKGRKSMLKTEAGVNTLAGIATAATRLTVPAATSMWFSTIQSPLWATLGMVSMATMSGGMLIAKNAISEWVAREEIELLHNTKGPITEKMLKNAKRKYFAKFLAPYIAIAHISAAFRYTNPGIALTPMSLMESTFGGIIYFAVEFYFYRFRNELQFLKVYEDPKTGELKSLGSNMHMTMASMAFGFIQYVIMVNSFIEPGHMVLGLISHKIIYAMAVGAAGAGYLKTFEKIKTSWLNKKGIQVKDLSSHHKAEPPPCKSYMTSFMVRLGY